MFEASRRPSAQSLGSPRTRKVIKDRTHRSVSLCRTPLWVLRNIWQWLQVIFSHLSFRLLLVASLLGTDRATATTGHGTISVTPAPLQDMWHFVPQVVKPTSRSSKQLVCHPRLPLPRETLKFTFLSTAGGGWRWWWRCGEADSYCDMATVERQGRLAPS
jgi:hypothetical protein